MDPDLRRHRHLGRPRIARTPVNLPTLDTENMPDTGAGPVGLAAPANPWATYSWLMAAVWVVFLAFPVMAVARLDGPLWAQLTGYVLVVVFGTVYVLSFLKVPGGLGKASDSYGKPWAFFAALAAVAAACIPIIGLDVLSFAPFLLSVAAYLLPPPTMWWVGGIGLAATVLLPLAFGQGLAFLSLAGIMVALMAMHGVSTVLIRRGAEHETLQHEYLVVTERDRMARDVHDLLGHSLTVLALKAQLAERLLDVDPDRARAELADIRTITAEALAGVRATVSGRRRSGLADELAHAGSALRAAGIRHSVGGDPATVEPALALPLAWVLREAVTNILRHARASECRIEFSPRRLRVSDDGNGPGPGGQEGNGLRGMRERATMAGALLQIGPASDGGTQVEVTW
ncbi:sensor histidine kinase [Pseudarthrobacter sp. P1]|uniref:sensor histidine kinase n=1 Tax=Pseudarthrobacter sp. P1 TaxID=3418418 RepID=UPI003CEB20FD